MYLQSNLTRMKRKKTPLLEKEILDAQANTKSASEAARYLGVNYLTYAKYAKMYGIFDRHKNPSGKGIRKGHGDNRGLIPLVDILAGKHPTYERYKLQKRLIESGTFLEQCDLCGFHEKRVFDFKVPLMLVHKDGNRTNHLQENLHLLCFNCVFLTFSTNTGKAGFVNNVEGNARDIPTAPIELDVGVTLTDDEKALLWQSK